MDNNTQGFICPKCSTIAIPGSKFCANCGTMLIDPALEKVGVGKQIWIYFVSIVAPPLGLIWFFKFIGSKSGQKRLVGIIALILTIVSSAVTIWVSMGFVTMLQQQLSTYQNIGL